VADTARGCTREATTKTKAFGWPTMLVARRAKRSGTDVGPKVDPDTELARAACVQLESTLNDAGSPGAQAVAARMLTEVCKLARRT
jgi:hypothetical protein